MEDEKVSEELIAGEGARTDGYLSFMKDEVARLARQRKCLRILWPVTRVRAQLEWAVKVVLLFRGLVHKLPTKVVPGPSIIRAIGMHVEAQHRSSCNYPR